MTDGGDDSEIPYFEIRRVFGTVDDDDHRDFTLNISFRTQNSRSTILTHLANSFDLLKGVLILASSLRVHQGQREGLPIVC